MILQLRNMQKIMTHGVTGSNITFYQETLLHCYGKNLALLQQFLIKELKSFMKVTITQCNNEQKHDTDKIQQHWKHRMET